MTEEIYGQGDFRYRVVPGWGTEIPAELQYHDAPAVATDDLGRVFVFARSERPVLIYTRDGDYLTSWGEGVFAHPHGISIAPSGTVWCTDVHGHVVRSFTPDGVQLSVLGRPGLHSDTGAVTSGPQEQRVVARAAGPFHRPTQAAVTSRGEVFVSDGYGNARVHRFSADGEVRASWGSPGRADGEFNLPHGIAVDALGRVLVADRENDRIQVFTAEGEHLESWTGIERPSDVAAGVVDEVLYVSGLAGVEGRSYWGRVMSTTVPARIRVLDYNGSCLATLETEEGRPPAGLINGHSICADVDGSLYIAQNVRLNQGGAYDGRTPRVLKLERL